MYVAQTPKHQLIPMFLMFPTLFRDFRLISGIYECYGDKWGVLNDTVSRNFRWGNWI